MTWRMSSGLVAAVVLTLTAGGVMAAPLKVGQPVGNAVLKGDDGKAVNVSQFRGQLLLLNFYASW